MTQGQIRLGQVLLDPVTGDLTRADGSEVHLRAQSREVLLCLFRGNGEPVGRQELIDAVWQGLAVTDDSLTQCIVDVRKAIGDTGQKIVRTVPRKGYRLFLEQAGILAGGETVGNLHKSTQPTIAVLPFEAEQDDDRWRRLGRGLAIGISDELARNQDLGVIGNETTYDASTMTLVEAGKHMNAIFVLGGSINSDGRDLHVTSRLLDVDDGKQVWSERWKRPLENYSIIHDDIVHRVNGSLVAHFWFGAINRAIAVKAKRKSWPSLSAYEQYLLGIENILWKKADYARALPHFYRAVEIDPKYARAWGMIGTMKQWISDVSDGEARDTLIAESVEAINRAYLYEPHDAFIVMLTSTAHMREGRLDAARRAVFAAVELSPNNADILAMAGWQAPIVGIAGNEALDWARKAIDLNPKGPPWHKLGLGSAAFGAEAYEEAIAAMEDAPPHHKKFVFLAASHMILGNEAAARFAAKSLLEIFPDYTLLGHMNFHLNDSIQRVINFAMKAGVPLGASAEGIDRLRIVK